MAKYAIQASNLTKVYKDKAVVKNVSLAIKEGEIYGFIGKNGAGKTTVMRLIGGLAAPDSGEITIFGSSGKKELVNARKNMGCLIESPSFYGNMTALENMEIRRLQLGLEPKELSEDALIKVGLDPKDHKKVKNFSLGMKQRLGIAVALIGEPKLLMLDEPINGLDPAGIVEIRDLLLELNRRGVTIFISSHILGELTKLAGVYGVIANGKMVDQFTVSQLQTRLTKAVKIGCADSLGVIRVLENVLGTKNYKMTNGYVYLYDFTDNVPFVMKSLVDNNVIPTELSLTEDDPESYFLKLMEGGEK